MPEKKSAFIRNSYSFISIILGLALLAPNFAFSENDDEDDSDPATEASAEANTEARPNYTPTATTPTSATATNANCDFSYFRVNNDEYFSLSQDPVAQNFLAETGIPFYTLKKSLVHSGTGYSYSLVNVTRTEETARFIKRTVNVLKTFPKSYITKLDGLCFLLIDSFLNDNGTQGITVKSVVTIPTKATNTTINHEVMHAVDVIYPLNTADSATWVNTNGSHKYVPTPSGAYSMNRYSAISEAFITNYARSSISEDRAELVSAMGHDYSMLLEKAKDRPIIKAKIALLIESLKSIDASLTESYWSGRKDDMYDGNYDLCARGQNARECNGRDAVLPIHPSWN